MSAVGLLINTIRAVQASFVCEDLLVMLTKAYDDSDSIIRYLRVIVMIHQIITAEIYHRVAHRNNNTTSRNDRLLITFENGLQYYVVDVAQSRFGFCFEDGQQVGLLDAVSDHLSVLCGFCQVELVHDHFLDGVKSLLLVQYDGPVCNQAFIYTRSHS